jgi:hypothetical protein
MSCKLLVRKTFTRGASLLQLDMQSTNMQAFDHDQSFVTHGLGDLTTSRSGGLAVLQSSVSTTWRSGDLMSCKLLVRKTFTRGASLLQLDMQSTNMQAVDHDETFVTHGLGDLTTSRSGGLAVLQSSVSTTWRSGDLMSCKLLIRKTFTRGASLLQLDMQSTNMQAVDHDQSFVTHGLGDLTTSRPHGPAVWRFCSPASRRPGGAAVLQSSVSTTWRSGDLMSCKLLVRKTFTRGASLLQLDMQSTNMQAVDHDQSFVTHGLGDLTT